MIFSSSLEARGLTTKSKTSVLQVNGQRRLKRKHSEQVGESGERRVKSRQRRATVVESNGFRVAVTAGGGTLSQLRTGS